MHSDNEMVNLRSVIEMLCYMVDENSDGVEEIMQLPTIDLVRCKECKHWLDGSGLCKHWSKLYGSVLTKADDYCSYGERKESE